MHFTSTFMSFFFQIKIHDIPKIIIHNCAMRRANFNGKSFFLKNLFMQILSSALKVYKILIIIVRTPNRQVLMFLCKSKNFSRYFSFISLLCGMFLRSSSFIFFFSCPNGSKYHWKLNSYAGWYKSISLMLPATKKKKNEIIVKKKACCVHS